MAVVVGPDVRGMVRGLARYRVEWVLAGSVAALAWYPGRWPFMPGDLDVVPARTPANLRRLAGLLDGLGAKPVHDPAWRENLSSEACAAWTPWPPTEERLDRLFETALGRLDVVPGRAGHFEALRPRSHALLAWDISVLVADPEDLAITLRPAKPKHAARRALMEEIRVRRARGEAPCRLSPD
ncbi:MAG: hypothetical protein AAB290_01805 [Candidatus Eisenbacteria bacterium]